ncbi:hypothetical protein BpHYR1_036833 [Brachionus plicatilis]|uniref:Uncharacterized protein n=1 Tax=Brachionus plicatilis TaxID=10195 RepID=A0A3M7RHF1_BRAPC|nr:hypothetical protein BpHYR1_036833 [Brachionus plicatilis]
MFKVFFILLVIKSAFGFFKYDANFNLLEKIMSEASLTQHHNADLRNEIFIFIDKVAHTGIKNTCDTKLIQSDVQVKMRVLKSIVSTCNGYCRLAMSQDGRIYGEREFSLDTIWIRVELIDEIISSNKAFLGAYYIKFVLADKFLCITSEGELFASKFQSKNCLWFNDMPRLASAVYDFNIVIEKNCKIDVLSTEYYEDDETSDDQCANKLNITSGFSPELQRFFRSCQSSLIKNEPSQATAIPQFKQIFFHQTSSFTTKPTGLTKKTFTDDPLNKMADQQVFSQLNGVMIEKAKLLCKEYLIDEIIFEKLTNMDYLSESHDMTRMPKLCIDYISYLKQAKKQESKLVEYNKNPQSGPRRNKLKKCFQFRRTPFYRACLEKHYKCYKYSNDAEKLQKCRKRYGIKVPRKKPNA